MHKNQKVKAIRYILIWIDEIYTHTIELSFSLKKEGNSDTSYNMDRP
jgi:hypothetical protein